MAATITTSNTRTYVDAIDALNTLQTPFAVLEARRKAGIIPDASSILEMKVYLSRLGYSPTDLDRLNVIHVAGTKGKGSTCAFVDSILAQYRQIAISRLPTTHGPPQRSFPRKVGLLTSPHLIAVRERIRLDSAPISEVLFAKYFFEVWDKLGAHTHGSIHHGKEDSSTASGPLTTTEEQAAQRVIASMDPRPSYARYLTLLAFYVFIREGVDCVILETGLGGEFDATNIVARPVATGITTLGIDHVAVLGDTVEKIAWHKAGIMKHGSAAFTVEQVGGARQVLLGRAQEKGVHLQVVGIDRRLENVNIRPDAVFQKKNASLAVALVERVLDKLVQDYVRDDKKLPKEFVDGLEQVVWRGRCEVKQEGNVRWHIDGAHTTDSLKMAARWFVGECRDRTGPRVLIFNQQGRTEAIDFLDGLYTATKTGQGTSFDHVIFCTNVTYANAEYKRDFVNHQYDPEAVKKLVVQNTFAERWKTLDSSANVMVAASIEEAITQTRHLANDLKGDENVQAFITGSLHLVGGALGLLEGVDAL